MQPSTNFSATLQVGATACVVNFYEQKEGTLQIGRSRFSYECPAEMREKVECILAGLSGQPSIEHFKSKLIEANKVGSITSVASPVIMPESPTGKKMDAYLQKLENLIQFRGSVLVKKGGRIILQKGYGQANAEAPNTPQTVFHLASVTKQFTAAAILKLVDEGKMRLEAPIKDFLPPDLYSEKWDGITVLDLLCHSSGLKNNFDCEKFRAAVDACRKKGEPFLPTPRELIGFFKDEPLRSDKAPYYSNNGYYLLGAMIEHVSGQSYGDFVKNRLLPKGMSSTGYYGDQPDLSYAQGYHQNENFTALERDTSAVPAEAYAAGGLHSTVEELALWTEKLMNGEVVSPSSTEMMRSPQSGTFGLGLIVDKIASKDAIHHGGAIAGYKSEICYFPETGDMIVLLSNNNDIPEGTIRDSLAMMLQNQDPIEFLGPHERHPLFVDGTYNPEGSEKPHRFLKEGSRYYVEYQIEENGEKKKVKDILVPLSTGCYLNPKFGTEWTFKQGLLSAKTHDGKTTSFSPKT